MGSIEHQTLSDRLCDGGGDFTRYDFTYASGTTMTIPGDWTDIFVKGTKIEITQSEVRYGYVAADSSYAGGNTTITVSPMNDAAGNVHTLDNAAISNVYAGNACVLRNHPGFINFNPSRAVSGGTAPTYTNKDESKFKCDGAQVIFLTYWRNLSGGTAGSGSNPLTFSLPIANENSGYQTIGHGTSYESGGTNSIIEVMTYNSATTCYLRTYTITTIDGNAQSSTDRIISFQGFYIMA